MQVIATAGHVDHGKSTLVRALTGTEPDRWAEERRRGLTIDLGYAWTTLDSGERVAFVDVPGHQRFIGNMLAGLGPAPAVLFVVAADEGWRRQSQEHLAAVTALGLRHGILAVTRSDRADPAPALFEARARLAASSLGEVPAVAVSGTTGSGLDELRRLLDDLVSALPAPDPTARVRLWVDRSFTIRGSGTVITGTLGAGTIRVGDTLELRGEPVRVRALQSLGQDHQQVQGVARVAVNLRQVAVDDVARGDTIVTPGAWPTTRTVDARLVPSTMPVLHDDGGDAATGRQPNTGPETRWSDALAGELMLHIGTVAVPVHVRPLGRDTVRLTMREALPLQAGDRTIVRDPGRQRIVAGALVLDADPPVLRRRGAAAVRGRQLAGASGTPDLVTEVSRRGAARVADLAALGIPEQVLGNAPGTGRTASGLRRDGEWLVTPEQWGHWVRDVTAAVDASTVANPLDPGLSLEAVRRACGLPDVRLVGAVARDARLQLHAGRVTRPGAAPSFGPAEAGLQALESRLQQTPFDAPERRDLERWGLGPRELAAAERAGRVLRLADDVVLLPVTPALAMRVLATLPQPFTTSAAKQALTTTRRVAIPLLEHLDARGWTRRLDAGHRDVVRPNR
ncbi:MAG: selenocysteine-specific translation elongation factor [Dermatophilaceae bacterium]